MWDRGAPRCFAILRIEVLDECVFNSYRGADYLSPHNIGSEKGQNLQFFQKYFLKGKNLVFRRFSEQKSEHLYLTVLTFTFVVLSAFEIASVKAQIALRKLSGVHLRLSGT